MDTVVSVSKGCFVYNGGFKQNSKQYNKKTATKKITLFEEQYIPEEWYETYKSMWSEIEHKIRDLNSSTYNQILKELVDFVKNCYNNECSSFSNEIIPCATLLIGVNQPDHITQFDVLKRQLLKSVSSHVAILHSQDSSNIKHVIESMVSQFINDELHESEFIYDDKKLTVKKSQCNMAVLKSWFEQTHDLKKTKIVTPSKKIKSQNTNNQLIVIIPSFENFNSEILQDLILILSNYTAFLPFVFIFGVATSVSALHKNFPYHISSKLYIQIFQSHSSPNYLNKVLENVFFTEKCPFQLGETSFKVLVDIFLFYDFSVTGLIQGIKYCMMEHYYGAKVMTLCCHRSSIKQTISLLNDEDLEDIRHLPSFRPYVELKNAEARISLLTDDIYLKKDLNKSLNAFHDYLTMFHVTLKILHVFVSELPNYPLGKKVRELYALCISTFVTKSPEYDQCIKILNFQSKEDIINMLYKCIDIFDDVLESNMTFEMTSSSPRKEKKQSDVKVITSLKENIILHINEIEKADWCVKMQTEDVLPLNGIENIDRLKLKEKFLAASKNEKQLTDFEITKVNLWKFLANDLFEKYLRPAHTQPYNELFVFNDISKIKKNIIGTSRAVIHTALTNPSAYLQCNCCVLKREETILPSLPDLSIVYKLYLECGKLINLYDWLQAFLTIVDPIDPDENDDEERRDIDPKIQARFTRAVSELQFLGFIKTSKRKTDHVARLTW